MVKAFKQHTIESDRRTYRKLTGQMVRVGRGDGKRVRRPYRPEGMMAHVWVSRPKVHSWRKRIVETLLKDRKHEVQAVYLGTPTPGGVLLDMIRRERYV